MTFFLNSEDKTLREGVVLEWVGAELKSGSVVTVDNGPAPLRRATVTELGRPVDERGRLLRVVHGGSSCELSPES